MWLLRLHGGGGSLLQRIGFRRQAATTSKVEIPDSAKKELGLQHHYRITSIVEKHKILEFLVINSDQTHVSKNMFKLDVLP